MSFREERLLAIKDLAKIHYGSYLDDLSLKEIHNLFMELLYEGVHGFCFSLYNEGQIPGDKVSDDQIRRRLEVLAPHASWIRTFSCTDGHEKIPEIAREFDMKIMAGAWLGNDIDKNKLEMEGLFSLAQKNLVDLAVIGNEVLYRSDIGLDMLLQYLSSAKDRLPHIPIGYADAYYEFIQQPPLVDACDIIYCNCYPFWEGTHFDQSLGHLDHMYQQTKQAAKNKRIIISETGWPGNGQSMGLATPGALNAMKYFINACLWAINNEIELFYFSSFDENWKVQSEGEVGAHWGIWDQQLRLKYEQ